MLSLIYGRIALKYLSKELPKPRRNAATSEARATNELREREKRESIAIENNKICSLPDLIDKMTGQVPNGVHMIIDSDANTFSFVSLKFDVVTKIKYCLRVTRIPFLNKYSS